MAARSRETPVQRRGGGYGLVFAMSRTHPPSTRPSCLAETGEQRAAFLRPPLVAPGWAVIGRDQIQLLDIWKVGAGWRPPLCWFAVKHSCGRVWPSVAALTEGPAAASRLSGAGARDILFGVGGVYLAGQGGFAADG